MTMAVKQQNNNKNQAQCWKTLCQCKSENNLVSASTVPYYYVVSVGLCPTDDLPLNSEELCYAKRRAKIMLQIIVVIAKV